MVKLFSSNPNYDIVVMADATGQNLTNPLPRTMPPRRSNWYFTERQVMDEYPEVERLWNSETFPGFKRPAMWAFQLPPVLLWLKECGQFQDGCPYTHIWMMQEDVAAYENGRNILPREIMRVDNTQKADLVAFNVLKMLKMRPKG